MSTVKELVSKLDLRNPIEKYWDHLSDRWMPERGGYTVILANRDIKIDGEVTLAGDVISCPLCGREDHWTVEGKFKKYREDPETGDRITVIEITVFECEHRSTELEKLGLLYWIPCRVVATVPADMVREFWEVS